MDTGPAATAASRPRRRRRTERLEAIVRELQQASRVDVVDLAQRFGVNEMTVRRDLTTLAEQGHLTRVHGGALPPRPPIYESRESLRHSEKVEIGRAVAGMIAEGETVGLDLGTTCHAVATELAKRSDLRVVTYSIRIALAFKDSESEVILLGGSMSKDLTLIDSAPSSQIVRLALDTLVLSCAGFAPRRGVTHFNASEVAMRQAIAASSDRLILAADSSKWGKHATHIFGPLSRFDTIVTDSGLDSSAAAYVADQTKLTIVDIASPAN